MKVVRLPVLSALAAALLLVSAGAPRAGGEILFREDFKSLAAWKELTFPGKKGLTRYSIVEEGDVSSCLRAESSSSASGLIFSREFSPRDWPGLRWRWRADGVYRRGNALEKAGDDYPLRLFVLFPYRPEEATLREKITFEAALLLHGEYPPYRALNYIWANRDHDREMIPNAYTARSVMIVLRGPGETGSWHEEEVNVAEDYRRAFGGEPPPRARLALMNDSDDTGGSSVSFVDFIEVFR